MRVWVTRAQPGAEATADRLRTMGHEPVVAPLLEVRRLPGAVLDLDGVRALAFTSPNAIPVYAALTGARDLPVFAVGDATAAAARSAGFTDVDSADGDVHALAARIAPSAFTGTILHVGAAEPAGDLVGALAALGVTARTTAIYETVAAEALPPTVDLFVLGGVLIHSPKAGRTLARILAGAQVNRIEAYALSAACAAPLAKRGFAGVKIAAAPNEAALLALLAP